MSKFHRIILIACFPVLAFAQLEATPSKSVREFVSAEFIHGVPYDLAKEYSSSNVPELLSMLSNEEMKPFWRNVIWVLAAIGDEQALDALKKFSTSRFKGEVDNHTFSALIQVNLAIGVLAHRNDVAFEYLQSVANPKYWRENPVSWQYISLKPGDIELLMTQLAINGLGLSGRDEAVRTLKVVESRLDAKDIDLYFKNNLKEAKEKARISAAKGLEAVLSVSRYHEQ